MTDFQEEPILVHATPTKPQIEATIRQIALIVGPILGWLGWHGANNLLNEVLTIVGPLSAALAFVFGQAATWKSSKTKATLAALLPDSVARFK